MKKWIQLWLGAVLIIGFISCGEQTGSTVIEEPKTPAASINSTNVPEIDNITKDLLNDPQNAALLYGRAKAYYDHKGYDQAMRDLNKAIAIDSMQADYYHLLADIYMDYFKSKQALDIMEKATERFPQRIPTLLKLGEYQMLLRQHNKSASTVDKVLKIDPQNAEAFFLLGLNFRETADTARAINSFTKATEIDPDLVDAWVILGNLFDARNNPIAKDFLTTAINIAPDDPKIRAARADYYYQNNKLEEAKADFMEMTRLDKQNSTAFFNIGLIFLEQDSIPKANQFFDFAVKSNPVYVAAYYYRGVCAQVTGDKKSAIRDFKQVLNFDPDFKDTGERLKILAPAG